MPGKSSPPWNDKAARPACFWRLACEDWGMRWVLLLLGLGVVWLILGPLMLIGLIYSTLLAHFLWSNATELLVWPGVYIVLVIAVNACLAFEKHRENRSRRRVGSR